MNPCPNVQLDVAGHHSICDACAERPGEATTDSDAVGDYLAALSLAASNSSGDAPGLVKRLNTCALDPANSAGQSQSTHFIAGMQPFLCRILLSRSGKTTDADWTKVQLTGYRHLFPMLGVMTIIAAFAFAVAVAFQCCELL